MSQLSFRSCIDLNKLFICMFPDNEVASKFTLGKTKCAYFMNYGIALHFKNILTEAITESPFYSLSFDESLNAIMQSCQMDVGISYWDDVKNLAQTRSLTQSFCNAPIQKCFLRKSKIL